MSKYLKENQNTTPEDTIKKLDKKLTKANAKVKKYKQKLEKAYDLYDEDYKNLKRKYKKAKAKKHAIKKKYIKACKDLSEKLIVLNTELQQKQGTINQLTISNISLQRKHIKMQLLQRELIRDLASTHPDFERLRNKEIENLYYGTYLRAQSINDLLNDNNNFIYTDKEEEY